MYRRKTRDKEEKGTEAFMQVGVGNFDGVGYYSTTVSHKNILGRTTMTASV